MQKERGFVFVYVALFLVVFSLFTLLASSFVSAADIETLPFYEGQNGISHKLIGAACGWPIYTPDYEEAKSIAAASICPGIFSGTGSTCRVDETPAFYFLKNPDGEKTSPVYQFTDGYISPKISRPRLYVYATEQTDIDNLKNKGWELKGIVGYVYKTQEKGTVPVYRDLAAKSAATYCYPLAEAHYYQSKDPYSGQTRESLLGYAYTNPADFSTEICQDSDWERTIVDEKYCPGTKDYNINKEKEKKAETSKSWSTWIKVDWRKKTTCSGGVQHAKAENEVCPALSLDSSLIRGEVIVTNPGEVIRGTYKCNAPCSIGTDEQIGYIQIKSITDLSSKEYYIYRDGEGRFASRTPLESFSADKILKVEASLYLNEQYPSKSKYPSTHTVLVEKKIVPLVASIFDSSPSIVPIINPINECLESDWKKDTKIYGCLQTDGFKVYSEVKDWKNSVHGLAGQELKGSWESTGWEKIGKCIGGVQKPEVREESECTPISNLSLELEKTQCQSFIYSSWSECSPSGTQTRFVMGSSPDGCVDGNPNLIQSCNYVPLCTDADWQSSINPVSCPSNGEQVKTWKKIGQCIGGVEKTGEVIKCDYQSLECKEFKYSDWSACSPSGTQTRTIQSSSPSGCSGGASITTQSCNYVPLCTDADWQSTSTTCSEEGKQIATWTKIGLCQSGTEKPAQEIVGCIPPVKIIESVVEENNGNVNITENNSPTAEIPVAIIAYGISSQNVVEGDTFTVSGSANAGSSCITAHRFYVVGSQGGAWSNINCQQSLSLSATIPTTANPKSFYQNPNTYNLRWEIKSQDNKTVYQDVQLTVDSPGDNFGYEIYNFVIGLLSSKKELTGYVVSSPQDSNSCTYTYSDWTVCSQSGTQSREVLSSGPSGCSGNPAITQKCQYIPLCTENDWKITTTPEICPDSKEEVLQTTTFTKIGQCEGGVSYPASQGIICNFKPLSTSDSTDVNTDSKVDFSGLPTCKSFTYSDWTVCSQSGTQSRVITDTTPKGCIGGSPIISQTCDSENLRRGGSRNGGNTDMPQTLAATPQKCVNVDDCKYAPSVCPKWGKQARTCLNTCVNMNFSEEINCKPGERTKSGYVENGKVGLGKRLFCRLLNPIDNEDYSTCKLK